jgi:aspartate 1-decarboxylase
MSILRTISVLIFLLPSVSIASVIHPRHRIVPDSAKAGSMELFKNYLASNLGATINSSSNDFAAVISVDDNTLYFVSARDGGVGREDFWTCSRTGPDDNGWSKPINVKDLNSNGADGAISLTADGLTAAFASNRKTSVPNDVNIWTARYEDGEWKDLVAIGGSVNDTTWDSQPAMSPDGQTLIFASNRLGKIGNELRNNVDLFISHRLSTGAWTRPRNLGSKINTSGYDATPFIAADGRTLYFCSNGHGGKGQIDIFRSLWIGPTDTDWSAPIDLPTPINSDSNDLFFSIPAVGSRAYFSSDRAGGFGKFDLWVAVDTTPQPIFAESQAPTARADTIVSIAKHVVSSGRISNNITISVVNDPRNVHRTATYTITGPNEYELSLLNLTGAKVLDLGQTVGTVGSIQINLESLASGTYLFVASKDNERVVERLVLIK